MVFAMLVTPVVSGATIEMAATTLFFIAVILSPKRRSNIDRIVKAVLLISVFFLILPKSGITAEVRETASPLASFKLLSVHAHRYQNFEQNRIGCEVFGEFQNIGTRRILSFTLEIKLLDAQNKTVATEALVIMPLSISREAPRGMVKAIGPKDYGYFSMDTVNCPTQWLEGKIKYVVKAVDLD